MTLGINPNFTGYKISDETMFKLKVHAQDNTEMLELLNQAEPIDEFTPNEKKKEKSGLKQKIASVAKFFTATEEITKGTAKGAVYGTMTGMGVMLAGWLLGALPQGFKKGNSLKKVFTHPVKSLSTSTKLTAALATAGVAVYHIVKGNLQANQRKAFVDQKLKNN